MFDTALSYSRKCSGGVSIALMRGKNFLTRVTPYGIFTRSLKMRDGTMSEPIIQFSRMRRLPPYVFAQVNELKMKLRREGQDIVDLGMGNPDLPTPQHIVDKLLEAAQKPHNHRYSASRGITKLREAIADWYGRRYNVDIDPETEAVVTIGAKEGLSHLVLALISPGDVVLPLTLRIQFILIQ